MKSKPKRSQRGLGRLYKRDKSGKEQKATSKVPGIFWLEHTIKNKDSKKRIRQKLTDQDEEPIRTLKEAKVAQLKIRSPFLSGDKIEVLKKLKADIGEAQQEYDKAHDTANPPLKIINAWHAYENSLERKPCSARTLQGYKMYFSIFESWINNNYSELVYMRDVISDIATEYATNIIQAGKSGNTFNKHIGFLKRIFREFATEIRADKNPFENIQRREQNTQSRRELTLQELITVIDDATGELALLLLIGGVTGLRLGDCATLQWSEVDLIRGLVRRIPNKTARRKQKPVVVGIPQMLLNALNKLEDKTGYVMPGMAERYTRDKNHGNIEKEIQRHFEACGIQCHKEGTGAGTEKRAIVEVGFHSLRHTYVSLHAERGTSVTVIQGNVGHGSPAMTAHYTHISEDKAVEVAKVLDCITTEAQEVPLEPQRERLKQLADTLSLEKIERIINTLQEY